MCMLSVYTIKIYMFTWLLYLLYDVVIKLCWVTLKFSIVVLRTRMLLQLSSMRTGGCQTVPYMWLPTARVMPTTADSNVPMTAL